MTNAFLIYAAGARLREWVLKYINEKYNGHSSQPELDPHDRVMEKEQETEMIQGQAFTTLWSPSMPQQNYNYYPRSKQHVLPVYNDCPFTTSSARRLLFQRSRQLRAWGRGISAQQIVYWMASLAVLAGVLAMAWNVGFVPFWITFVQVRREDKVVMIPCMYRQFPLLKSNSSSTRDYFLTAFRELHEISRICIGIEKQDLHVTFVLFFQPFLSASWSLREVQTRIWIY